MVHTPNILRLFIALCLFCQVIACSESTSTRTVTVEQTRATDAAEQIARTYYFNERQKTSPNDTIVIITYDRLAETSKTFEAFPLKPILDSLIVAYQINPQEYDLIFTCTDGYEPSMPLTAALNAEGYVTYQNQEIALATWEAELQAKMPPFYLTWQVKTDDVSLPNPYGLVAFRFESAKGHYQQAFPLRLHQDELAIQGFATFRKHCIKCHSINKEGGSVGPELNHPKNITTYWQKADIQAFVALPQSYRYNAKMPPTVLTNEEFEAIYYYLLKVKAIDLQ